MQKRQASSFYPHFEQAERPTIDYFVGLFNRLMFQQEPILTDFLNPRERSILQTVVGGEAFLDEFGGFKQAERKRVWLTSEWTSHQFDEFEVAPFEIKYPSKFAQLSHGAIMGTLANAGIELKSFGDIITDGKGRWQFFAKAELTDFFLDEIQRIGSTKVKLNLIDWKEVLTPEDESVEDTIVAASMRVDAILAAASKHSRKQIQEDVNSQLVKLNWHNLAESNIIVNIGDVISLRHFGRVQVMSVATTKKGKFKVVLKLWRTKGHKRKIG
ncbi:YlmH family RNA-binding protein [Lactobacillus corticis]|uniref:Cell division protein n=1 Tax=Lactobacillus corticis TaxID=2201249 RepID=A0A916QKP6_9LACO|nr:YlmH/Sll1252 family protein [Lactobacillus corticis]GFZ27738.1 cell division protein [Lactobacillus corticis]